MAVEDSTQSTAKHWQECADVYDFLEQVRLRPGVWLPGGSLRELELILTGYRVALGVHGVDEFFGFWPEGGFTRWLHERHGVSSSLGWVAEIERTVPEGSTPVEEFFRLLDEYRAARETPAARRTGDPGIEYTANTFVTLFWRQRFLIEAELQLRDRGFRIIRLPAGEWSTETEMHRDIAVALDFPGYYGHNLDALNDCLGDVACGGPYDDAPEGAGLVLSFTDYDRFASRCPRAAQIVLDIIADQARRAALVRRRLICLVHSNDPDIRFEPVGAMPVLWNSREWLDTGRR